MPKKIGDNDVGFVVSEANGFQAAIPVFIFSRVNVSCDHSVRCSCGHHSSVLSDAVMIETDDYRVTDDVGWCGDETIITTDANETEGGDYFIYASRTRLATDPVSYRRARDGLRC